MLWMSQIYSHLNHQIAQIVVCYLLLQTYQHSKMLLKKLIVNGVINMKFILEDLIQNVCYDYINFLT